MTFATICTVSVEVSENGAGKMWYCLGRSVCVCMVNFCFEACV